MPTYEYVCTNCAHEFEFFQSMKDDPLTDCPECTTGRVRRKIGLGAGIIFKGSGFYETDFKDRKGDRPKEPAAAGKSESTGSGEGSSKSGSSPATEKSPSSGSSGKKTESASSASTSSGE